MNAAPFGGIGFALGFLVRPLEQLLSV